MSIGKGLSLGLATGLLATSVNAAEPTKLKRPDYDGAVKAAVESTAKLFCDYGFYFDGNNNTPYNMDMSIGNGDVCVEVDVEKNWRDKPVLGCKILKDKYNIKYSGQIDSILNGMFPTVKKDVDTAMRGIPFCNFHKSAPKTKEEQK